MCEDYWDDSCDVCQEVDEAARKCYIEGAFLHCECGWSEGVGITPTLRHALDLATKHLDGPPHRTKRETISWPDAERMLVSLHFSEGSTSGPILRLGST